ncbi:MAG: helix-turn-helix transcriptional regulator [Faecalimonas umbilicata]
MSHFVLTRFVTSDIIILHSKKITKGEIYMIDAKEIGSRLLKLRGETPRELVASEIGVSISAIAMYENGERIPRDGIKIKLANFYKRTVQEIFFDKECHI